MSKQVTPRVDLDATRTRLETLGLSHGAERLEQLEGIAMEQGNVTEAHAIQAGREVRILVRPDEIDDLASTRLARDIVRQIEETLTYPGQIKVTVIRETRSVEYAK